MHQYDMSSKWLIQHHGDALLWLGGVTNVAWWRALQAELVQQRRLPDGLVEAQLAGEPDPDLFLLEIATRLETRLSSQLTDDILLCLLERQRLPQVITVVLTPTGRRRTPSRRRLRSRRGLTTLTVGWHVVELWRLPAEDLLRANLVGLVPWIPLTGFSESPERILRRCRQIIDREAPDDERVNLLTVTQILAGLRYNDPGLFRILGGEQVMIESPVLQDLLQELMSRKAVDTGRQYVLKVLESRFGAVPEPVIVELDSVSDEARLLDLVTTATHCPNLEAFHAELRK